MSLQPFLTGAPHDLRLSDEDMRALRQREVDVSDIDRSTRQRAEAGFRHAYDVAQLVTDGKLDPLSA
jgi:hypothetical protein